MKTPFVTKQSRATNNYYDLIHDYELIDASFAQQYHIRLINEDDMEWDEFCNLLAGLNEKTPLVRHVAIRAETDPEIIRKFTPEQKRIRTEWASFLASTQTKANQSMSKREYDDKINAIIDAFKSM